MKKNLIALMTAAAMIASMGAVFADEPQAEETPAEMVVYTTMPVSENTDADAEAPVLTSSYIVNDVTVTEIGEVTIATVIAGEDAENMENVVNYTVDDDTLVLGYLDGSVKTLEDVKVGDTVTVFSNAYAPAPLILPPQYKASVIIVHDDIELDSLRLADVDTYLAGEEGRLVNAAGTLEVNVGEETVIVDKEGNEVSADELVNKDLVVFYSMTTRSIPPQTTPDKIVVLGENEMALAQINAPEETAAPEETPEVVAEIDFSAVKAVKIGEADVNISVKEDGTVMAPIRKIAEALGFDVAWVGETQSVVLNSGMYSFTIGTDSYIKGRMAPVTLGAAPELKNDTTYVPVKYFIEILEAEATMNDGTLEFVNIR